MTGNEMDEHLGKSEQATELADEGAIHRPLRVSGKRRNYF